MASTNQRNLSAERKAPVSKKKKIIMISAIAGLVALAMLAASLLLILNWDEYYYIPADRKTVATCNGYKIPYEELRHVTMLCKSDMAYEYGEDIWKDPATAEAYRAELSERVEAALSYNYALLTTSESVGSKPSSYKKSAYVDEQIKLIKEWLSAKGMDYDTYLKECYMTRHYHRVYLGLQYLEYEFLPGKTVELDGYDYHHDQIADYVDYVVNGGDYVSVMQVRVESQETAEEIIADLRAVSDLDARIDRFSEYVGSEHNKDTTPFGMNGLYYTRGQRSTAYSTAAFALRDGEISDPVTDEDGIWIIMRLPIKIEYVKLNAHTLLNHYYNAIINSSCTVEFNDYGKSIDLVSMQ